MVTTQGHLFGGRLDYQQPAIGFRSGIEPVLLAASIPTKAGEHVLEAGTGAGAALLCLSARVPGVQATGVESDEKMAALATANAQTNSFPRIGIVNDRIETISLRQIFDHALANPPYHPPNGTASPSTAREAAKRGSDAMIATWIGRLGAALRHRGSLTLIVPAGCVPAGLAAMSRCRCPCTIIFPLWPKLARPAKLVLLRGTKNALSPLRLMPGLILHQADGSFTAAARAILTDGAALSLEA